jgi:hypothetical protein
MILRLNSAILKRQEKLDYFFNYVTMFIHIRLIPHQKFPELLKKLQTLIIRQQLQPLLRQRVPMQYRQNFIQTLLAHRTILIYPVKQYSR